MGKTTLSERDTNQEEDCLNEQPELDEVQETPDPVLEVPTLKSICLAHITKNVKKLDFILANFFNGQSTMLLDTHLLAEVLLSSVHYISVDTLRHMEALLPALILEDECEECWKKFVKRRYSVRDISAPFPFLVNEVKAHVASLSNSITSVAEKENILDKLSEIPFSNELAKQTNMAMTVNSLRKDSSVPSSLAIKASEITAKWKKAFKSQQHIASNDNPEETTEEKSEGIVNSGNVGVDSVQLHTWRQLYAYFENKEQLMLEKGAKRFSALSNTERDKRKTSLSADSSDLSQHKKQKLQKILSSGSRSVANRAKTTVFRPSSLTASSSGLLHAVKSSKGHSAVDIMQARKMQSTKKIKVVTTSGGGVMRIPRGVLNRSGR